MTDTTNNGLDGITLGAATGVPGAIRQPDPAPPTPPTTPAPPTPEPVVPPAAPEPLTPPTAPIVESFDLDKDGNLVNEKGEVVQAKGTFEVDAEGNITITDSSNPVFTDATNQLKELGFELLDTDGNEIKLDNKPESIVNFALQVGAELAASQEAELFEKFPVAKDLIEHLAAGKSPIEFFNKQVAIVDYSQVKVDGENIAQQRDLVLSYLTKVANTDTTLASKLVKLMEDGGELEAQAKDALTKLKAHQDSLVEQERIANREALQAAEAKKAQHWASIKEVIDAGRLASIDIPAKEKADFFKFLAYNTAEGVPANVAAYNKLTQAQKLELDYFLFKGLSIDELVAKRRQTEKVQEIQKRKLVLKSNGANRQVVQSSAYDSTEFGLGSIAFGN